MSGSTSLLAALAGSSIVLLCVSASVARADDAIVHHRVSTKNADAQREFDAALTLIYAFNPEEASYHFQQAARLDPQLAMAYWGIALAAGPNINTAYDTRRAAIGRDAIGVARSLAGGASAEERRYIEALAPRYDAPARGGVRAAETAYATGMTALARAYPDDLDAQAFAAESLMDLTPLQMWTADGRPNRFTRAVIALLDGVVRRDPNHLGANHYLIHTYEDSPTPQRAVVAARRLAAAALPPGAEHLAHMPAHVFTRVGDYDAAIAASLKAIAMFRQYVPAEHSNVHNAYYHHDFQVLDHAYMMSGQWAKAKDAADQSAMQVGDTGAAVETYLRFHKWRELLALAPPQQPGLRWRYAHAMAAAAAGDVSEARSTLQWLASLHDMDPRTGIAHATLAATLDVRDRRAPDAVGELRRAVALQDRLPAKEPSAWYYPIRETLGARLLLTGDAAGARRVFEDDLRRNPGNPRSLYGLSEALAKSDPGRAASTRARFAAAWQHADVGLGLDDL